MLTALFIALAGLGPEVPLAPAESPGASQLSVSVAYASGHTLAVWTDGQLRGTLDGAPIDLSSAGVASAVIGAAAGSRNFLIAWQVQRQTSPYNEPVLALRVGFDGRVLDPAPITVDVDTHGSWGGNIAYNGRDFVIATMEKHSYPSIIWAETIVTTRVSEDGAPGVNVRLTSSGTSGYPRWPRVAWAVNHFLIGYDAVFFGSEGISGMGISLVPLPPEDSGDHLLLSDSEFPNAGAGLPRPAVAVGNDRVTIAWMNNDYPGNATMNIAQTDLEGRPLLPPKAIAVVSPRPGLAGATRVEIAWDGAIYLVAWTTAINANTAGVIQAVRLSYDGSLLDSRPFDVAGPAYQDFSVAPISPGFAIGYSLQVGIKFRAYMRTVDRPPLPHRRRVVR